jgi:type VI secretion system protein ImpF
MARKPRQPSIQSALLDRLIDREPANRSEAPRPISLADLKDAVRRDLIALLNSRRTPHEPPAAARELAHSVYCYGLPELTGVRFHAGEDHRKVARVIESAIVAFEPRLLHPVVSVQAVPTAGRVLRFQIEALLRVEPGPARVFFDTTLELTSGQYNIGGEGHAR